MKTLIIVNGHTGLLGRTYYEKFIHENYEVIGISRLKGDYSVDLLDIHNIKKIVSKINYSQIKKIIIIHPVGKFSFERSFNSIDVDIFNSNVLTFTNFYSQIRIFFKGQVVNVCFGSISDKYNIPFWKSYTYSKNFLRNFLRNETSNNTYNLFINVSTVNTGNENTLRPNAKKDYWLSTEEVVNRSFQEIINANLHYKEIDVFKHSPCFDKRYYVSIDMILEKWNKEMQKPD